jgi:hypothetical protein
MLDLNLSELGDTCGSWLNRLQVRLLSAAAAFLFVTKDSTTFERNVSKKFLR